MTTGTAPSDSKPASPPAPPASTLWRTLTTAVRFGLAGLVLWAAWETVISLKGMLEGTHTTITEVDQPPPADGGPGAETDAPTPDRERRLSGPESFLGVGPFAGGGWEFRDLPWRISSEYVAPEAVEARLRELPARRPTATDPLGPFDGRILQTYVEALKLQRAESGDVAIYSGDMKPTGRAALITCKVGGEERLLAGRLATDEGGGRWRVCELLAIPGSQSAAAAAIKPILPLPEGSVRLGTRRDPVGKSLAELVTVPLTEREALVALWKKNGWTPRVLPGKKDFTDGLYCIRGLETVAAWFVGTDSDAKGTMSVLLVRSDDGRPRPALGAKKP